jgi:hypothetical protein
MPAATVTSLDLHWIFHPGCDIRNSTVATNHWKTTALVDMYKVRGAPHRRDQPPLMRKHRSSVRHTGGRGARDATHQDSPIELCV